MAIQGLPPGEKCLAIIRHYEQGPKGGHAERPYRCPAGHMTIGWGHKILKGEDFSLPMSRRYADDLLLQDIERVAAGPLRRELTREPTQDQWDALLCLVFNSGRVRNDDGSLIRIIRYFNEGLIAAAFNEFGRWIHGNGQVLQGLVNRRRTEARVFNGLDVAFF